MQVFEGKSAYRGIAIGKVTVFHKRKELIQLKLCGNVEDEIKRFRSARCRTMNQLQVLYEETMQNIGKEEAGIFVGQQAILDDVTFIGAVEQNIRSLFTNAEYAVNAAGEALAHKFAKMEDEYVRERALDIRDVCERLIAVLLGENGENGFGKNAGIVVAEELSPSDTAQLDKAKVLAFVTAGGTKNSHTAILAGSMEIPALMGTGIVPDSSMEGKLAIADGVNGRFILEPDSETLALMQALQEQEKEKKKQFEKYIGRAAITPEGKRVRLCANIGSTEELQAVEKNDAEGIGLFRSEYIFLERTDFPTEEEQFAVYKTLAEFMGGKPVVIRTLDIGADKQCDYFGLVQEENPALGCRAIRVSLRYPEIFKTQLRAILRAGVYGNLSVMYPMITTPEELLQVKKLVEEVAKNLQENKTAFRMPKQGIMIETPAAVMMADELAKMADFFSIGSNDLGQYTFAMDRNNARMEALYNPRHPALLRMIEMAVRSAHRAGIPVGICGELAADSEMSQIWPKLDVDELSVSPAEILPMRKRICDGVTGL